MWLLGSVVTPAAAEPVSLEEARVQCRIDPEDGLFDAELMMFIRAARAHIETLCGITIGAQSRTIIASHWTDLAQLPIAPVRSVSQIAYVDPDGANQVLASSVWRLQGIDRLDPFVALKPRQVWPTIQTGTQITLTVDCGFDETPEDLTLAALLLIGHWFRSREAVVTGVSTATVPLGFDQLITNFRRWL